MAYLPKEQVPFQISQRADFFEEEVGLETTLKRPIVNTRDEPHADAARFRRLHVILGDANMSEYSTFLKVGTTAIVLSMIEDGFLDGLELVLETPVPSLRAVSYDLTLKRPLPLANGRSATALEVQGMYLEAAKEYAAAGGLASIGDEAEGKEILRLWEEVLSDLEVDPMRLADKLDWVAKYRLVTGYMERHDIAWDDPRLAAIDLQFHDIRKGKSLFYRLGQERLLADDEIEIAVTEPPRRTRAYFRGKCLAKYAANVAAANWDSMIFDLGEDPLRRVPMMDPLRGTADHVDELINGCDTAAELLRALGS
ncbi:MAG: proteasome accessory factor PafA2 family protein [Actinomycetota bacterium]|nr:proteasome accessory factor PafA2 family protein [Actinomycetota bacterium]